MARQVGPIFYEGTMGDIVFYKVGDQYFSRYKGNYKTRKQMQRIPKFKRTLQLADQFGKASKLASWVYQRYLPVQLRKRGVMGKFTAKASCFLKEGKSEKEINEQLIAFCEELKKDPTLINQ